MVSCELKFNLTFWTCMSWYYDCWLAVVIVGMVYLLVTVPCIELSWLRLLRFMLV